MKVKNYILFAWRRISSMVFFITFSNVYLHYVGACIVELVSKKVFEFFDGYKIKSLGTLVLSAYKLLV